MPSMDLTLHHKGGQCGLFLGFMLVAVRHRTVRCKEKDKGIN